MPECRLLCRYANTLHRLGSTNAQKTFDFKIICHYKEASAIRIDKKRMSVKQKPSSVTNYKHGF